MHPSGAISPLSQAIQLVGVTRLAAHLRVSRRAVMKWEERGRLPRTEWTGETDYARRIETLTAGAVTREQLLAKWPEAEREAA